MLAKRRALRLNGHEIERTPLLVPSFSSKGFPDVGKIVEYASEVIDGVALISAYDLHYERITTPITFPSLIFLDSGGYEASKDKELSDIDDTEYQPSTWTAEMHEAQLSSWNSPIPTVFISFDSPSEKCSLDVQIDRAKKMALGRTDVLREILLKPETKEQIRLQMKNIVSKVHDLACFNIIGVTEKEVGNSILARMLNIAKLRRALDQAGLDTPIHVFGSLDTVTTPLYFLAGADIFDGLSWLRYAYHQGATLYKQNFGAIKFGVEFNADLVNARCWDENYLYMKGMQGEMRRFLNGNAFTAFQYHSELFRTAFESLKEELGE